MLTDEGEMPRRSGDHGSCGATHGGQSSRLFRRGGQRQPSFLLNDKAHLPSGEIRRLRSLLPLEMDFSPRTGRIFRLFDSISSEIVRPALEAAPPGRVLAHCSVVPERIDNGLAVGRQAHWRSCPSSALYVSPGAWNQRSRGPSATQHIVILRVKTDAMWLRCAAHEPTGKEEPITCSTVKGNCATSMVQPKIKGKIPANQRDELHRLEGGKIRCLPRAVRQSDLEQSRCRKLIGGVGQGITAGVAGPAEPVIRCQR